MNGQSTEMPADRGRPTIGGRDLWKPPNGTRPDFYQVSHYEAAGSLVAVRAFVG
jgi:hypothetical protein